MAGGKDALAMLGSVSLFEGLSKKELRAVIETGKEVSHDEGHEVVRQGDSGAGFHLILEGEAAVVVNGRTRATLGPGDYFGEMSLIDEGPRSATVRTSSPLRTFSLTSWKFSALIKKHPSMALKMLVEMSRRLRQSEGSLTE